jgi:hypothetical protein
MPGGDDIFCGEIGSRGEERWSPPVRLTAPEVESIESLAAEGIVQFRVEPDGVSVAGIDHVGTVHLPGGRRLHIRPKVGDLVLLDWLAYVGDAPPLPPQRAGGSFALRGSFASWIADQFLAELDLLTRRSLRASFAERRHDSSTVRGRLLPGFVARNYHRLPMLPQARRTRTLDTPHHRLLAAALDRLPPLLDREGETARRLGVMNAEWADVARPSSELPAALAACASHCPPGYAAAVRLAAMIIAGASPAHAGAATGAALLVSLAGTWERALRRMTAEIAPFTGWKPVPDARRTKRWDDGPGFRDPTRWMTADVILAAGDRRWVLDAKYKRGYGDEERADRFQMTAYAMAFDARRATLAYPTAETERARWRLLLAGQIGGQPTTIDSIELPMAAGPVACRRALLDAMLALGAPGQAAPPPRMQRPPAGVVHFDG